MIDITRTIDGRSAIGGEVGNIYPLIGDISRTNDISSASDIGGTSNVYASRIISCTSNIGGAFCGEGAPNGYPSKRSITSTSNISSALSGEAASKIYP